MVEPVPTNDDRLLARVEPVKKLAYLFQPIGLRQPLLVFVGSSVGRRLQEFHVGCPEAVAAAMLVRDRAGVVLDDRPRSIGAELIAAGVVKLLHGPDQ